MKRKRLGKAQRKRVFDMFGGRCAYCGCELSLDRFSIDHIVPLHNGGEDCIENMMPSCNKFATTTRELWDWRNSGNTLRG